MLLLLIMMGRRCEMVWNSFAYLTVNFTCNFTHERSKYYAKKSVGLLRLQMPEERILRIS